MGGQGQKDETVAAECGLPIPKKASGLFASGFPKPCFEDVLPNHKGDSDRIDLPFKHMNGKGIAVPKSLQGQHTKSSIINEKKGRAIFKIALADYYDHYYHIPEFKEHVVNYLTRHDFVEWFLNRGISDLRAFFGVCKGTQDALLGRAYRADGLS